MLNFLSLGQLCASLFPDIVVANIMSQLVGTFAMLFSGLFLLAGQMPQGWKWSALTHSYDAPLTLTAPSAPSPTVSDVLCLSACPVRALSLQDLLP
jgi:hypothetical protein